MQKNTYYLVDFQKIRWKGVAHGPGKNPLDFGGDPAHVKL